MKYLIGAGMILSLLASPATYAAERTVKLDVQGMTCASCPYQVKTALKKIDGVAQIEVSLENRQAVVTFNDEKTDIASLIKATTNAGFPSTHVKQGG